MKVILLQKVKGLGDIDQVKEVADGFARNFLFPQHLAVQVKPSNLAELAIHKNKQAKEAERDLNEQQALADKLAGLALDIKERVSEKGLLYASIGPVRIVAELAKKGVVIEKNQILMKPVKEAGEFEALVKLRHGLEATISIIVSA